MREIKVQRAMKGITQEELAKILDTTQGTISNWERGDTEPDINALKAMAKYFGCSVDDLLRTY